MRKDYKELFDGPIKEKYTSFIDYAFNKNQWWLIVLIVIIAFCLPLVIRLNFVDFLIISTDTARIVIDQRTANIATIISITLVVVGFLINNLAVKEGFTYQLLFRHSHLYPIIYFTLSTIGCMFIISLLRDHINNYYFVRLVNIGTYMAIIILFQIGFLFRTIIQFTNDRTIWKLLHNELMEESIINLKRILLSRLCKIEFDKEIQQTGAELKSNTYPLPNMSALFANKDQTPGEINEKKSKERYVYDINIRGLKKIIQKKDKAFGNVNCLSLTLEEIIPLDTSVIWQEGKINSKQEKSVIKKSIILKRLTIKTSEVDPVRKYFDQKIEILASANDHRGLQKLLESFLEIYKLQMQHLP